VDAERLERRGAGACGGEVPGRSQVAGHPPALVRVDHDLHLVADGIAHGLHHPHVVAPVGMMEADLERAQAAIAQRHRAARPLLRPRQLAGRGIGRE
jgi:hypothetical protein